MAHEAEPRILIVEDDEAIGESLSDLLTESGYAVDCVSNGRQALELLRSGGSPPALILLDLTMPVMDGFQFCAARSEDAALRDVPIVIMSADGQVQAKLERTGAQGYLKKPMSIEAVLEVVERHRSPGPLALR
jgi:CheY-like chemotaxis protein